MPSDPHNTPPSGNASWARLDKLLAPLQWDWPGWLPRGFLTVLAAEPGVGKSALCLRLAACYLSRHDWPDGAPFDVRPGPVLWCESEASQFLNLDRARRWQLDLSRILSPLDNPLYNFKLDRPRQREALLRLANRQDVRFIILDSLRGLRSPGRHAMPIGELLLYLADIARISGKAVLLTHHLRKQTTVDNNGQVTVDRLLGSGAVAQIARVVWAVDAPDPFDPQHRRLSVIKNNLAPLAPPLGMRISDQGPEFGPAPLPPAAVPSELERAVQFLRLNLAGGPQPFKSLRDDFHAAGFSGPTMRRAKKRLAVVSLRLPGQKEWYWDLPGEKH